MSKLQGTINPNKTKVTQYQAMWAVSENTINKISASLSRKGIVSKIVQAFKDTQGAVISLRMYPFTISNLGDLQTVTIAGAPMNDGLSDVQANILSKTVSNDVKYEIPVPMPDNVSFLDYEPYTTYQMYVPFYGIVSLSANMILGKTLTLQYSTDFHSGRATVYISNGSETLWSDSVSMGVNIPFGSTNEGQAEIARVMKAVSIGATMGAAAATKGALAPDVETKSKPTLNSIGGAISQEAKFAKNVLAHATGQVPGVGPSIVAPNAVAKATIANGIMQIANHKTSLTGLTTAGDMSQFSSPLTPYIIKSETHIVDINNYATYNGYAVAEEVKLGEHHGYCEVSFIHMEGLPDTLEQECDMIEQYLKSGVILP